jgi:hypothetical protein
MSIKPVPFEVDGVGVAGLNPSIVYARTVSGWTDVSGDVTVGAAGNGEYRVEYTGTAHVVVKVYAGAPDVADHPYVRVVFNEPIASVTGSVGSVSGNVGGSVQSVTNPVTVGTNNDKSNYALASAYDPAKNAASSLELSTQISALADLIAAVPAAVWAVTTRTLSGFGDLVSTIWSYATRKLTSAYTDEGTPRDMAAGGGSVEGTVDANIISINGVAVSTVGEGFVLVPVGTVTSSLTTAHLKNRISRELKLLGDPQDDEKTDILCDALARFIMMMDMPIIGVSLTVTASTVEYTLPGSIRKMTDIRDSNGVSVNFAFDEVQRVVTLETAPSASGSYTVYGTPKEIRTNIDVIIPAISEDFEWVLWGYVRAFAHSWANSSQFIERRKEADQNALQARQDLNWSVNVDRSKTRVKLRDHRGNVIDDSGNIENVTTGRSNLFRNDL